MHKSFNPRCPLGHPVGVSKSATIQRLLKPHGLYWIVGPLIWTHLATSDIGAVAQAGIISRQHVFPMLREFFPARPATNKPHPNVQQQHNIS